MNKYVKSCLMNKSNAMLENKKKREHLETTINLNSRSIDYIDNELSRARDIYKLTESDVDKEKVELNEYILFALKYLDDMYSKSLLKFKGLK